MSYCSRCAELQEQMRISAQLDMCDSRGNYDNGFRAGVASVQAKLAHAEEGAHLLRALLVGGGRARAEFLATVAAWVKRDAAQSDAPVTEPPDVELMEKA